jgi:replication factor C large subunit
MTDWTERYRPSTLSEVRGNDSARDDLLEWAETWDDHREAVVVHGSPGVGKTSAAHALAADMGWETVELNASDRRTADAIERYAGRASKNATLAGATGGGDGRQLIILDEADNVAEQGGASAITETVKAANQPIVLIANDYYDMSRGLRDACREIEFRDVSARSILPVLRDICRREGVEFESEALERIAEVNDGDLRSAVNDLQAAARGGDELTAEDVVTGDRDRSLDLFPFLDQVLKESGPEDAIQAAYRVDETPDDLTKWVAENVTEVYEGAELARAYGSLSDADRWLGRVWATQEYGYWRYATDAFAGGVAAARDGEKGGWTRYSRPEFWTNTSDTAEDVVRAVAEEGGFSMATARREVLPFLRAMTHHCKPRELTVEMATRYGFDEAAVSFVTGSGETTNKVASIVADAEERREAAMAEHSAAFGGAPARGGDDDAADGDGRAETPTDDAADAPDDDATTEPDETDADEDDGQAGLSDFM